MNAINDEIHDWFGLSYANYLVLPRVLLEAMPRRWQREFVECMNDLAQTWKPESFASYKVQRIEGDCDRSCDVCTNGADPYHPHCRCTDPCEHELPDELSDYRHPSAESRAAVKTWREGVAS